MEKRHEAVFSRSLEAQGPIQSRYILYPIIGLTTDIVTESIIIGVVTKWNWQIPLSNTFLLFGNKIRGGTILGSSDFQQLGEVLSKTHLTLDSQSVKTMGRPFDFIKQKSLLNDLPQEFSTEKYLTAASVVNTLYSLFGVPENKWRTLGRNLPIAPVLNRMIHI